MENTYGRGNAITKTGDDYPIRNYLLFKNSALGLVSYPHSCLNYIWSSRIYEEEFLTSTYTEKSIMIPLQQGESRAGSWATEEINVVKDYRKVFGKDPPRHATIAIMNDSDNRGESSISYIDFIEIFKRRSDLK